MQYFVILGDIVKSRDIQDRATFQSRLIETMGFLNNRFKGTLVSSLMVNSGDSFQGIFSSDAPILSIADTLRFSLALYCSLRLGIGFGKITTEIDPKSSILCDGPAFWNAKEALDSLYEENYYQTLSTRFEATQGKLEIVKELVNQSCLLGDQLVVGWKKRQLELATYQILNHGYEKVPQIQLAQELGLSPQQVFTTLKAMGLYAYLDSKNRAQTLLLREIEANQ
jgi:DNA-binding CsgD family transcriptional regulator